MIKKEIIRYILQGGDVSALSSNDQAIANSYINRVRELMYKH